MNLENGRISILFNENGLRIELKDFDSGIVFAIAKLNQEQTCQALSRLSDTHCTIEVLGLEYVGKKQEHKEFVFEILPDEDYKLGNGALNQMCLRELKKNGMGDWIPDNYYNSQNSLFSKDNKKYARAIIRRWI